MLVLTGLDDERRGIEAVGAGAQDYLVKGQIDGQGLTRAVHYAVERLRADEARQRARGRAPARGGERPPRARPAARAAGQRRPTCVLTAHYRPGRRRALLGGDFYDAVQTADGTVHAVIGDVSGHGPDAAALGVCLRIAWRTLVIGGHSTEALLPTLQVVHGHERHHSWMFTTLCMVDDRPRPAPAHDPARRSSAAAADHRRRRSSRSSRRRASRRWASSTMRAGPPYEHTLPEQLVAAALHRRADRGPHRRRQRRGSAAKGSRRWCAASCDDGTRPGSWPSLVERAEELNGGPMLDDVAAFLVQRR